MLPWNTSILLLYLNWKHDFPFASDTFQSWVLRCWGWKSENNGNESHTICTKPTLMMQNKWHLYSNTIISILENEYNPFQSIHWNNPGNRYSVRYTLMQEWFSKSWVSYVRKLHEINLNCIRSLWVALPTTIQILCKALDANYFL